MPGGRPPKYETPEELEKAIEQYFEKCVPRPMFVDGEDEGIVMVKDSKGNPIIIDNPPTVAGLALFLGYADRQSIYDQDARGEEFSCIKKRAILRISEHHEARLSSPYPVGSIFWQKNHGWTDKTEMGLTGPNGGPILTQSLTTEEAEEFRKRFGELHPTLTTEEKKE